MNYAQAQQYLNSFVNYEKQASFAYEKLGLTRVRELFALLDIDYSRLKYIHIAGTKGKGSTAQFCASILAQSGHKVGLYTSPHIVDFRERIKIIDKQKARMIDKSTLAKIVTDFAARLSAGDMERYSYFEVTTALALEYFLRKKLDYIVLEAGLGGRLDATNVVNPKVSVLTPIDFDHQHILGKTLSQIAREKAGIIKDESLAVSASQDKAALAVIETQCRLKNTRLYLEGRDFFVSNVVIKKDKTVFDFSWRNMTLRGLEISLKGDYQAHNAALACAALASLGQAFAFKEGLKKANIFGRFSMVNNNPLVILDVAHNDLSFTKMVQNLQAYYPDKKVILIFACAQDKDAPAMIQAHAWHKIFLPKIDNARLFSPKALKTLAGFSHAQSCISLSQAYAKAKKIYDKKSVILLAGSFFLAGEFLRVIKNKV